MLRVITGLFFGVVIAFFALLNITPVTINYYFGQFESRVALIMLLSAMAGALTVGLIGLIAQIRAGFVMWDYKNKSKHLTKEVEELREQKKVLSDDISFLNAEFDLMRKEKQALEEGKSVAVEAEVVEQGEVSDTDDTSDTSEIPETFDGPTPHGF